MQLISVITALAAFEVAAALPSAIKGTNNDLATRDAMTLGSKLCTGINFGGDCETISNVDGMKADDCIVLDYNLQSKGVSSIQPLEHSFCTYYITDNCQDLTSDACGTYAATSPIDNLTTVTPTPANGGKCGGNMDKKIASFKCRPF